MPPINMSTVFDHIFHTDKIECDKEKTVGSYKLCSVLGCGRFSEVRLGHHLSTGFKVAVKCVQKLGLRSSRQIQLFQTEVENLSSLRHPNIIYLYEAMVTQDNMYMVLDHIEGKTLSSLIKERVHLAEETAQRILYQIVSGVSYCHSQGILHRDIKSSNIMIKNDLHTTLIDFGLSCRINQMDRINESCGTPVYTAPEVYFGVQYGFPRDVWSMGVVLYEMVTGNPPFCDITTKDQNDVIRNMLKKLTTPSFVSEDCRDLLKMMLTINETDRILIKEILNHGWLKSCNNMKDLESSGEPHSSLVIKNEIDLDLVQNISQQYGVSEDIVMSHISQGVRNNITASYNFLVNRHLVNGKNDT